MMATHAYADGFPEAEKTFANLRTCVVGTDQGRWAFALEQRGDAFVVTHESPAFEVSFELPGWTPIYVDGAPVPEDVPVHAVLRWTSEGNIAFVGVRMVSDRDPAFWLDVRLTRCSAPASGLVPVEVLVRA